MCTVHVSLISNPAVKYHNVSTLVTMVRCSRAHYRAVWSALTGVVAYKSEPCTLALLHVAGTIQSSQRALLKHNMATLKKARNVVKEI